MRLKAVKLAYLVLLTLILIRLFYWQILRFDDLSAMAEQQHLFRNYLEAPRGQILAADAAVLVANQPKYLLYGLPQLLKDKSKSLLNNSEQLTKLAKILLESGVAKTTSEEKPSEIGPKEIADFRYQLFTKLNQDLSWVILEKNVSLETKLQIEALDIEGLGFESGESRFYPESSSAAHLLGFVGSDALGKHTGYFGLEGYYNGHLKGVGGVMTEEKDARGMPIAMGRFVKRDAKEGDTLILNIDRTVQYMVEKKLLEGMKKYGAIGASAIVMDPKTGAIIAMASYPSYDPSHFADFPKEYYKNPVVAESYEPGSTFKVLVMAAGINENLITPQTECDICAGPIEVGGFSIRTWNNKYRPNSTMSDVIIHSDNTGMVYVSRKLGIDKMYQYIENFGFGKMTGIDLQDETTPKIRPKSEWREIDLATSSFGQGIAGTPLQVVRAVGALANEGKLMEPHMVQAVQSGDKTIPVLPKVIRQVVSPEAAKLVTEMMVKTVHQGEAKAFAPKGFKIAGKTGTAQIPVAGHYDANKTIASFVGFAPADDPKFVMLVKYNEPSSSIFGAETAAPTFFEIAKQLLIYYNIAPSN